MPQMLLLMIMVNEHESLKSINNTVPREGEHQITIVISETLCSYTLLRD